MGLEWHEWVNNDTFFGKWTVLEQYSSSNSCNTSAKLSTFSDLVRNFCMEDCVCHWIKNKKGNCDFLSHDSDFFFSQLQVYISQYWELNQTCQIWTSNCEKKVIHIYLLAILTLYIETVSLYNTVQRKIHYCKIKSCNSLFYFLISGRNGLP